MFHLDVMVNIWLRIIRIHARETGVRTTNPAPVRDSSVDPPFIGMSSRWGVWGPALGSGCSLRIVELSGTRTHIMLLLTLFASSPVLEFCHCSNNSAKSVALVAMLDFLYLVSREVIKQVKENVLIISLSRIGPEGDVHERVVC